MDVSDGVENVLPVANRVPPEAVLYQLIVPLPLAVKEPDVLEQILILLPVGDVGALIVI